jgi:hypothetical protein
MPRDVRGSGKKKAGGLRGVSSLGGLGVLAFDPVFCGARNADRCLV